MISPYTRCTQYYKHYKITVISTPSGNSSADGVNISSYIYDPSISPDNPIYSSSRYASAFSDMSAFNTAIQNEISALEPNIDALVNNYDSLGGEKWANTEFPDPLAQEIYKNSIANSSANSAKTQYGSNRIYGKDISGAPGTPQVTYASPQSQKAGASGLTSAEILAQTSNNRNQSQKKHRKGIGRNESIVDVVNVMSRALNSIDANRIKYASSDGSWAIESRNETLERLTGLETSQLPLSELSEPTDSSSFSRYVYELVRGKPVDTIIDGKSLTGLDMTHKYGEELAKYIDILDGNNIEAVREAAMAKRNTGIEFVPHSLERSISVATITQKTIDGGEKTERSKSPDAFPDNQYNQVGFTGNVVPPDVFNEVYKPRLGITYETPQSWMDYLRDRRNSSRDTEANKSISTLTTAAAEMQLSDTYFSILNAAGFDALTQQIDKQERVEIYNARRHAGGAYYDLLVNADGLESDPNTVTLRRVVASFSATLLCLRAQCSECKHYKGQNNGQSLAQNGSATLRSALSCEYGYTDSGGKAKGPESFCGTDEASAINPAVSGIRYELNSETSDLIREARNAIEKDGSEAYLSLVKQYKSTDPLSVSASDAAASAGTTSSTTKNPSSL